MRMLLPLLALCACRPITAIGDKIIGLTEPVLVGGLIIGTSPPDDPELQAALEEAGLLGTSQARLVVADALEFQDIEAALLQDVEVEFTPENGQAVAFQVDDAGWYGPTGDLPYEPGTTARITAVFPDRMSPGIVDLPLPEVASVDVERTHPSGTPLTVDLSGQGFDYAFATVYDLDGVERYSNAPTTESEIIDLVLPAGDPVESVTIPAEVFTADEVLVVGVAGLKRAAPEGIEGLNEALTSVLAGQIELFPVVTGSSLVANAVVLDVLPPPDEVQAAFAADGLESGLTADVQAADLLQAGAPVEGAAVSLNGVRMYDLGAGQYHLEGESPELRGEATVRVLPVGDDTAGGFDLLVPLATDAGVPSAHAQGSPLTVDAPGGPWKAVLVSVADASGVRWSNMPETAAEWQSLVLSDTDVDQVTIPASAFPDVGPYVVAVAGMEDQSDTQVGLNPQTSHALAGTLDYHPVLVGP